ncbi:FxSxx-COOH system tetratricopeptide repeat protein, partial [Frankia sp. Cas3]|uniref:FxSxx-COOH system tetratricopeptide repeat protein n=1 Tax=Frankia sp. Cas3 TaxID=3073926 RepID=UPI003A100CEC
MVAGAGAQVLEKRVDFFISHAGPDSDWAQWVAVTLLDAGYSVELDVWDWTAGTSFVAAMNSALSRAVRVLALASPEYFARTWTAAELDAAIVRQVQDGGYLVPVQIRPCEPGTFPPLLDPLVRIELDGVDEPAARARLLEGLAGPRRPASGPFPFPGSGEVGKPPAGRSGPPIAFPGRLPPVWGPVPARNLFFTGRESLLARLNDQFSGESSSVAVSALQGLGGAGKTQLAVEYVWRSADRYSMVWWIDAETSTSLTAGLAALADSMEVGSGDIPSRARAALAELGRRAGWLLVYDNAADAAVVTEFLPPSPGRLIVTCRDPALYRVGATLVEVGEFTRDETIELLRRHVPSLETSTADQLGRVLGDLPLAVDQAGAFLAASGMTATSYIDHLGAHAQLLLGDATLHHAGLAATVATAYERLASEHPAAAALLDQLACLAPEPVPLAALPTGTAQPVPGALLAADPLALHTALAVIGRYALARRSGTSLHIHRLVHTMLRSRRTTTQTRAALEAALTLLATASIGQPESPADWPVFAALTPHVIAVASQLAATDDLTEPVEFRRLLDRTCWYLHCAGQNFAARELAEPARDRWITLHGADHSLSQTITITLTAAMADLGQYQSARTLAEDTLARRRRLLGDDDLD